jgi:hypothetical protein
MKAKAIWDQWTAPKLIQGTVTELQPDIEPQEHDHDIDVHGAVIGAQDSAVAPQNSAVGSEQNGAVGHDSARASAPIGNIERHAMQSLANSKPPKLK